MPLTLRSFLFAFVTGIIFAFDLFFWHRCIHFVGPGLATILGNFQVFFMALSGFIFFHEKLRLRFILFSILAFCGLGLLVGIDFSLFSYEFRTGLGFGFLTAVAYTIYLLFLKKTAQLERPLSPVENMFILSFVASLLLASGSVVSDESFLIPDLKSLLSLAALGLFSQAIGWVFIARGVAQVRASLAGLIVLIQPTLAFIWDILIFDRPLTISQLSGAAITIFAIYMAAFKKE